jgi:hypothetical protein
MASVYAHLKRELLRYTERVRDASDQVLVFPTAEFESLSRILFREISNGGSCTMVIDGRTSWNPRSQYYRAARDAARRGLKIQRLFLLPQYHLRHSDVLKDHLALDREAGIDAQCLYVGDLLAKSALPSAASLDFGVWDNSVVCTNTVISGGREGIWHVSQREPDLQMYRDVLDTLELYAPKVDAEDSAQNLRLEEPMLLSAPLARLLAPALCRGDHVARDDCSWYHGAWQYLRLFDLVSTPTWHGQFYNSQLRDAFLLRETGSSILISGTADYSVYAHVLWASALADRQADVSVLDFCETPLVLCKWFHKQSLSHTTLTTISLDLLELGETLKFNIIATDAFLTRFPRTDRTRVLKKWSKLLAPGGRIITTVRVDPSGRNGMVKATVEEASLFRDRCLEEATKWRGFIDVDPQDLAAMAYSYAERMGSFSVPVSADVRSEFEEIFDILHFEVQDVPGEMHASQYARIVACHQGESR